MIMKRLFKSKFEFNYNKFLSTRDVRAYSVSYFGVYLGMYYPSRALFVSSLECLPDIRRVVDRQDLMFRICEFYKHDIDFSSFVNTMLR